LIESKVTGFSYDYYQQNIQLFRCLKMVLPHS